MDETKIFRKCAACNVSKPRADLIKITVNQKTKEVRIAPSSDFVGRSVYVCKDNACIDALFKKGRIFKNLKIKQDDLLKEKIRAVLEK